MTRYRLLLAGVLVLLWVPAARGQGIRLTDRAIGFDFDGSWLSYQSSPGQRRLGYREWLSLGLAGSVVDPRLFNFALVARPALAQRTSATALSSADTKQIGLDAEAHLLAGWPVSASFSGLRVQGTTAGEFGTLNDFYTAQMRGRLAWRNRYLPARIEYTRRTRDNLWTPVTREPFRLHETLESVRLTARNSKTRVTLERLKLNDRVGERDFTANRADLTHALRWGKGSRLSSGVQYLDRVGTLPYKRLGWTETLRLQHTTNLRTEYRYRFLDLETGGTSLTGRSPSFSFNLRIRPGLSVGGNAFRQSTTFPTGREVSYGAGPSIAVNIDLPLGARFSTSGSVGFQRLDREATDGLVSVVGEEHVIDASGSFFLDNPAPEPATVVVNSPDGTVVFLADADYRLVVFDALIEIQILPGGRIAVGDTVLVNYSYFVTPDDRQSFISVNYSVQLSLAGLRFFVRRNLRDGRILEGPGLGFTETDDNRIGLEFRRSMPSQTLEFLAERHAFEVTDFSAVTYLLRGVVTQALGPRFTAGLVGTGSWSTAAAQRVTLSSANLHLTWIPAATLRLQTRLGTWHRTQEGLPDELFIGGGLSLEWRVGLVDAVARYDHNRWRVETNRVENRLTVHLVRRF